MPRMRSGLSESSYSRLAGLPRKEAIKRLRTASSALRRLISQMQEFTPEELGATEQDQPVYTEGDNQEVLDNIASLWEWVNYLSSAIDPIYEMIETGDGQTLNYILNDVIPPLEQQIQESQRSLWDKGRDKAQGWGQGVRDFFTPKPQEQETVTLGPGATQQTARRRK